MQDVVTNRDKYIGGSDIPTILGINPFKTRWELLQEKAGLSENDFEGNQYTDYGNIMEEKIRNFINKTETNKFIEGKHKGEYKGTTLICHTDGENDDTILEIKTTSKERKTIHGYKSYLVQLLFYMFEEKKEKGKLAVYTRPEDFSTKFDKKRLKIFDINIADFEKKKEMIYNSIEEFRNDLLKIRHNPFLREEDF